MATTKAIALVEPAKENNFEQYSHHDIAMWVRKNLKGKHRLLCMCYNCESFHPCKQNNCPKAQELYRFDVQNSMVTPVLECRDFIFTENPDLEEIK